MQTCLDNKLNRSRRIKHEAWSMHVGHTAATYLPTTLFFPRLVLIISYRKLRWIAIWVLRIRISYIYIHTIVSIFPFWKDNRYLQNVPTRQRKWLHNMSLNAAWRGLGQHPIPSLTFPYSSQYLHYTYPSSYHLHPPPIAFSLPLWYLPPHSFLCTLPTTGHIFFPSSQSCHIHNEHTT